VDYSIVLPVYFNEGSLTAAVESIRSEVLTGILHFEGGSSLSGDIRRFVYHRHGQLPSKVRRIGVVGAGDCAAVLVKELLRSRWLGLQPVAFFSDKYRRRCSIHGVPIVGRPECIDEFKTKLRLDEMVIAMPSASPRRIHEILKLINHAGLVCRTVPSLDQLVAGHVTVTSLRPLNIHDFLGRSAVEISDESVRSVIEGRTIIVTGAGGNKRRSL
jgi:FlaA1/EpsC-like NDP-sugar epimerase